VADVSPGSPANAAGIVRGDVITSFNGKAVKDSHDLPAMVAATPVNEEVTVKVLRDGKEHRLSVKVGRLPSEQANLDKAAEPAKGKWGLQLHDLSPQIAQQFGIQAGQGVVVVGVEAGSVAHEAGIRPGDVIIEVNRQTVNSVDEVKENINRSKDRLLLLVQRQNGKLYVPLTQQG
jgi:serine protease Do